MRKFINILTYGLALISIISSIYLYLNNSDNIIILSGSFLVIFFLVMNFIFKYFFKV